jgi:hypothetical protein
VFVCTAILSCTSELIYFRLLLHNADDVLIFLPGCRTIRRRAARRRTASQLQLPPAGSVCCGVSFFTNGNRNLYRGYRSYRCGAVIKTVR